MKARKVYQITTAFGCPPRLEIHTIDHETAASYITRRAGGRGRQLRKQGINGQVVTADYDRAVAHLRRYWQRAARDAERETARARLLAEADGDLLCDYARQTDDAYNKVKAAVDAATAPPPPEGD